MLASDETDVISRIPAVHSLQSHPRRLEGVLAEVVRDVIAKAETADPTTAPFQSYVGSFQSFLDTSRDDTSP
jgi:hypothetical protein